MQDAKHIMKINEEHWNDVNSNFSCYKFDYDAHFLHYPTLWLKILYRVRNTCKSMMEETGLSI